MPGDYQKETVIDYLIRSTPIHEFLKLCESTPLDKRVLDCGAGGKHPPLALFFDRGYETYGIEISKTQLKRGQAFCKENGIELNIFNSDMRKIPFSNESFSFVYAYDSIFFLKEADIAVAMSEIERVLKPKGLCFISFRSVDDTMGEEFPESDPVGIMLGNKKLTYHEDDEPDIYFQRFQILRRKKRIMKTLVRGEKGKRAYLDYIAEKI